MTTGEDGHPLLGYCNFDASEICINSGLGDEARKHTLRHEIGHAVMEECGTNSRIAKYVPSAADQEEIEEDLIRTWLPAVMEALRSVGDK